MTCCLLSVFCLLSLRLLLLFTPCFMSLTVCFLFLISPKPTNRPKSGSMILYSRKRVRYRRDGYCWKKRKDGKTTREDHMKLKVQGTECIYGCYVHSAILPTFHRRCYWLLQVSHEFPILCLFIINALVVCPFIY